MWVQQLGVFLQKMLNIMEEAGISVEEEVLVDPEVFLDALRDDYGDLLTLLEDMREVCNRIKRGRLMEGMLPRSHIGSVGGFLQRLVEHLETRSFAFVLSRYRVRGEGSSLKLELVALDPREVLETVLSKVHSSVSMSGTLEPIDCYKSITGLPEGSIGKSLPSPFPRRTFCAFCVKGLQQALRGG